MRFIFNYSTFTALIMRRPFEIKISTIEEVRMGSLYNCCDIELVGFNKTKLFVGGWQDKYVWSNNSEHLILIKWDFEKK